ncbi:MAG: penicillin-binding transpeptidase domain-containing protein [Pseudomonadota bacterium]
MKQQRSLSLTLLGFIAAILFGVSFFWNSENKKSPYSKRAIAQSLTASVSKNEFPPAGEIILDSKSEKTPGQFTYSIDQELQEALIKQFESYKPDYGAVVAIDPKTGAIRALFSYTKDKKDTGNIALRASFPAASVFKIVTAAAALDKKKANPETVISFTGANHTLYRQNLRPPKNQRWVRKMRLREAFARSVNTVFGKLGIYTIPKEDLSQYAEKFQFNKNIPVDLPVEVGTFEFLGEDPLSMAEVASGFNRNVLMSPIQGAMMAGAIANDGLMMEPYLVDSFTPNQPGIPYQSEPRPMGQVVSPETARELRSMMQDTVRVGTSRKSFRGLARFSAKADVEMGGKTGSLTGNNPKGKYDWFVGYAKKGDKSLGLAVLTIHEEKWTVKSSYLASKAVEQYFAPDLEAAKARKKRKKT